MHAQFASLLPFLLLSALLALAVWHDVDSRRIPNRVVFPGALLALALQAWLPEGAGLFVTPFGSIGVLHALAGLGLGLAILLPMYMLRAMGAGDVKLLAMVGAYVGPQAVVGIAILTMLAGGVLALGVAAVQGTLQKMVSNTYHLLMHSMLKSISGSQPHIEAPAAPSGKLPYAIAIAAGTAPYLIYAGVTGQSLFS